MKAYGLCCHGLGVIQPIDFLAQFLNEKTPNGVHFEVVGGIDPQPYQQDLLEQLYNAHAAGNQIIFIGHSKGAMMAFYLADELKKQNIPSPLFISLDSVCWSSNAPGLVPWTNIAGPQRGIWYAPDNVKRWAHYRQAAFPGGGYAELAPGNSHTHLTTEVRLEGHIEFVAVPEVQQEILDLVLQATK